MTGPTRLGALDWESVFEMWDTYHPVDYDDEDGVVGCGEDTEDIDTTPRIPTQDEIPLVVDYSDRAPGDWVISGPLVEGACRGRLFGSPVEALQWAAAKYGRQRVRLVRSDEEATRWAVLIKKA